MKNLIHVICASTLCIASSAVLAASPVTIINNTSTDINIGYSHCNAEQFCNMVQSASINNKTSGKNSLTVMAPMGMERLSINSAAFAADLAGNLGSLTTGCQVPDDANVVILDNYGSKKIVCTFGYGS